MANSQGGVGRKQDVEINVAAISQSGLLQAACEDLVDRRRLLSRPKPTVGSPSEGTEAEKLCCNYWRRTSSGCDDRNAASCHYDREGGAAKEALSVHCR